MTDRPNPIKNYATLAGPELEQRLEKLRAGVLKTGEPVDFGAIELDEKALHPQPDDPAQRRPELGPKGGRLAILGAIERASRITGDNAPSTS